MKKTKNLEIKLVISTQTEDQQRRFETATDLLLAELVRRVKEKATKNSDGSTRKEIHRSAEMQ